MFTTDLPERLKRFSIPGRVSVLEGNGDLPKIGVTTDWSTAEIYLHGAQVTDFQRKAEAPLLFTSQCSGFASGQPIRGGIPIIFPWFGAKESGPSHGFARIAEWELHEATTVPDGGVTLRFSLPLTAEGAMWLPFAANYVVTITDTLALELTITNLSGDETFDFENCLHTYLSVGDVEKVSVTGLKGAAYFDKADNFAQKVDQAETIQIASEVDRIYYDTASAVEVADPTLRRRIRIDKSGSASTVVWNPWITKARQMPDFGNDEYKQMLCVESGNVAKNRKYLPPGRSAVLKVVLSSSPL